MRRLQWDQIPEEIKIRMAEACGSVHAAASSPEGITAGVATTLETDRGRRFVKAIPSSAPVAPVYRAELGAGAAVPLAVPAPRLVWGEEAHGWITMLFECVEGRPADLAPTSADLPAVGRLLRRLAQQLSPSPWPHAPFATEHLQQLTEKASALLNELSPTDLPDLKRYDEALTDLAIHASDLDGGALVHYDLSAANTMITQGGAVALDWGLACRAASWLDAAMLTPRLISAGHTPAHAEAWLTDNGVPLPDSPAVTGIAAAWTLYREHLARHGPDHLRPARARAAAAGHSWFTHRTT